MSTTYVSFTPAEREQARMTDLAEFLRQQGYDLRREGAGSVWMSGGEKVSVQGNLWYNQYTREGGDAIDFARRLQAIPHNLQWHTCLYLSRHASQKFLPVALLPPAIFCIA